MEAFKHANHEEFGNEPLVYEKMGPVRTLPTGPRGGPGDKDSKGDGRVLGPRAGSPSNTWCSYVRSSQRESASGAQLRQLIDAAQTHI